MNKREFILSPGEFRVIRISINGLFELIYETVIERMSEYFDIVDISYMTYQFGFGDTLDSFFFGIYDDQYEVEPSPMEILPLIGYTTESLLYPSCGKRYKTVFQNDSVYTLSTAISDRVEHLQKGECRFIRATHEAIEEFVQDIFIQNLTTYFHLDDSTKVTWFSQIDENLSFMFVVYNKTNEVWPNLDKLAQKVGFTTESLFSARPLYRSVTMDSAS